MADFDTMAKTFDTPRRIERANMIASKLAHYINSSPRLNALEYGCGTGLIGMRLLSYFNFLTFMDPSLPMIEQVNHKILTNNIQNAKAVCGTLQEDISREYFSYIISSMVLHHVVDVPKLLGEFYARLSTNGKLLFVDLDKNDGAFHADELNFQGHHGFEHTWLYNECKKAGFDQLSIETFYYGIRKAQDQDIPYSLFLLAAEKR